MSRPTEASPKRGFWAAALLIVLGVGASLNGAAWILSRPAANVSPVVVPEWRKYATSGHRLGPVDARVVFVVFVDEECPYCRRAIKLLRDVQLRNPETVAIVEHHYPLPGVHPRAYQAALALECADQQASFWRLQDALLDRRTVTLDSALQTIAMRVGVRDTAAFDSCVIDRRFGRVIDADLSMGRALGIKGTPTILIDSLRLRQRLTVRVLERLVMNELSAASRE